jgi:hypothetical protein
MTEWRTAEEGPLADVLRMISAEPEYSILRLEMEAALHSFLARRCYEKIDRLRRSEHDRAARKARRTKDDRG